MMKKALAIMVVVALVVCAGVAPADSYFTAVPAERDTADGTLTGTGNPFDAPGSATVGVAVDGDDLYCTHSGSSTVEKWAVGTGTLSGTWFTGAGDDDFRYDLAVDASYVYVPSRHHSNGGIQIIRVDRTTATAAYSGRNSTGDAPRNIKLYNGSFYIAQLGFGVYSMPIAPASWAATSPQPFVAAPASDRVFSLAFDSTGLMWGGMGDSNDVMYYDTGSSLWVQVLDFSNQIRDLEVFGDELYVSWENTLKVYSISGTTLTHVRDITGSPSGYLDIPITPIPEPAGLGLLGIALLGLRKRRN